MTRKRKLTILEKQNKVYREIIDTNTVINKKNEPIPLRSILDVRNATQLYYAIQKYKPKQAIEIGLGFGGSTMAICTAFKDLKTKHALTSIDPFQEERFEDIGLLNIKRSKLSKYHTLIQDFNYFALPKLFASNKQYDFGYIDGWHTFDYTLLDTFYIDKMLTVDGVIGFNDCDLKAVEKTIQFLLTHRKYKEVTREITLSIPEVGTSTYIKDVIKEHLFGLKPDRYLQKTANWEPHWNFFEEF